MDGTSPVRTGYVECALLYRWPPRACPPVACHADHPAGGPARGPLRFPAAVWRTPGGASAGPPAGNAPCEYPGACSHRLQWAGSCMTELKGASRPQCPKHLPTVPARALAGTKHLPCELQATVQSPAGSSAISTGTPTSPRARLQGRVKQAVAAGSPPPPMA